MLETFTLETLYSSQIYIINSVDNTKLSTVSVKHAPPPQEKVLRLHSKMDCPFHPHPPTFKENQNLTGGHTNSVIVVTNWQLSQTWNSE